MLVLLFVAGVVGQCFINASLFLPQLELEAAMLALEDAHGTANVSIDVYGGNVSHWPRHLETNGYVVGIFQLTSTATEQILADTDTSEVALLAVDSTSTYFDSCATFPNLLRMGANDAQQATAMARVCLHFKWERVAVIASDDVYGRPGGRAVAAELAALSIGVEYAEFGADVSAFRVWLAGLRSSGVRCFVLFSSAPTTRLILEELFDIGLFGRGHTLLMSDANLGSLAIASDKSLAAAIGAIIMTPHHAGVEESFAVADFPFQFYTRGASAATSRVLELQPANLGLASFAYDAVRTLLVAIDDECPPSGASGPSIIQSIKSKRYAFATGSQSFSADLTHRLEPFTYTLRNIIGLHETRDVGKYRAQSGVQVEDAILWPGRVAETPGNRVYSLVFVDHEPEGVIDSLPAAYLAIDEINVNNFIGGGNALKISRVMYSNCSKERGAMVGKELAEEVLSGSNILAVIGMRCSADYVGFAGSLQANNIQLPTFSMSATAESLADTAKYPNLFQMISNDAIYMRFILRFVKSMEWRHVSLLHTSDTFGESGLNAFLSGASELGLHTISITEVPNDLTEEQADATAKSFRDGHGSNIIILWMVFQRLDDEIIKAMGRARMNTSEFVVINGDEYGDLAGRCPECLWMRDQLLFATSEQGPLYDNLIANLKMRKPNLLNDFRQGYTYDSIYVVASAIATVNANGQVDSDLAAAARSAATSERSAAFSVTGILSWPTDSNSREGEPLSMYAWGDPAPVKIFTSTASAPWISVVPIACPAGTFGSNITRRGSTYWECIPCPVGSFSTRNSLLCHPCTEGSLCAFASPVPRLDISTEERRTSQPIRAGPWLTADGVRFDTNAFVVLAFSIVAATAAAAFVLPRTPLWKHLHVLDWVFYAKHYQEIPGPVYLRMTPFGGLISCGTVVIIVCLMLWLILVSVLDQYAVVQNIDPGNFGFVPSPNAGLLFSVTALGMDLPLASVCEAALEATTATGVEGTFASSYNAQKASCTLEFSFTQDPKKSEFILNYVFPRVRAQAIKYSFSASPLGNMPVRGRPDVSPLVHARGAFRPPPARVFYGANPATISLELQPTSWLGAPKLGFDAENATQGLVPFITTTEIGAHVGAEDYFDGNEATGVSCVVAAVVSNSIAEFTVVSSLNIYQIVANITALSSLTVLIISLLVYCIEAVCDACFPKANLSGNADHVVVNSLLYQMREDARSVTSTASISSVSVVDSSNATSTSWHDAESLSLQYSSDGNRETTMELES